MSETTSVIKSNLVQRLIVGILGAALAIFLLVYNHYTFYVVCGILTITLLLEFYKITEEYKPVKWLGLLTGASLLLCIGLLQNGFYDSRIYGIVILLSMMIPVSVLFNKDCNPLHSLASTYMGLIYTISPLAMMMFMSQNNEGTYNRYLILAMFLIIWSNDTGAYFAGKSMGKTKLFERISPNKTIEGSMGGVILAFVIMTIYFQYIIPRTESVSLPFLLIFTLVISGAGIVGDLVESLFKRSLKIKDSGALIPGHGGFLDRFDALIFAIPFGFVCYLFS